jgi:hypothetical protein
MNELISDRAINSPKSEDCRESPSQDERSTCSMRQMLRGQGIRAVMCMNFA